MTRGALLLAALLTCAGCTVYHYVDTCTRSQLMLKGYNQTFELPALEDQDWRCNQQPVATPTPSN